MPNEPEVFQDGYRFTVISPIKTQILIGEEIKNLSVGENNFCFPGINELVIKDSVDILNQES